MTEQERGGDRRYVVAETVDGDPVHMPYSSPMPLEVAQNCARGISELPDAQSDYRVYELREITEERT